MDQVIQSLLQVRQLICDDLVIVHENSDQTLVKRESKKLKPTKVGFFYLLSILPSKTIPLKSLAIAPATETR